LVTQYAGVRPYGVGLLVGGVDEDGPKLFETEPSGTLIEWHAQSIGRGAEKARKVLEKDFKPGMELKPGLKILMAAMRAAEKDASPENIEVIEVSRKDVKRIPPSELKG